LWVSVKGLDHAVDARTKLVATSAQTDRRPNGQFAFGNRYGQRHGKRSAGAVLRRKSGAASRKAAGLLLARLDLLGDYRHRPRPIREDQHRHLGTETLDLLARLGLLG
jgi:hypothetical protein